jgi:DNA-binding transcriptional MerR regulator
MSMFTIGEFSRIARVSPRQLRHYEALGFFAPEQIDPETGYRFYSALQLPRLNRILALKELGLTLAQIQHLLEEEISAEELHGMLTLRKAQIEQTIQGEFARIQTIEARLRQIERHDTPTDDVVLKAIPAQTVLSLRQVVPSLEAGFALMAQVYRSVPRRGGIGHFAVVLHSDSFETEHMDVEMGFLLTQDRAAPITLADGQTMTVRTVPAVATMATLVCVGFANHDAGYGTLGTWIEQHHWQLAGPSWEVFIEPFHPAKLDEAVIEIQIPITKHEHVRDMGHAPILS